MILKAVWTPQKDALLKEQYVARGATWCATELGITWRACTKRASRLGIRRLVPWTAKDDQHLRMIWGVIPIKAIAREMKRTAIAIYARATTLGLQRGCPQGYEYLSVAAARTGYQTSQLRRILRWGGVQILRAMTRPDRCFGGLRTHHMVEPSDVDDAVTAWLLTEPVEAASRRHGYTSAVLVRLLEEAKSRGDGRVPSRPRKGGVHWRVPTILIDELFARRAAARDSTESLDDASLRHRIDRRTISGWLAREGITTGYQVRLDPSMVDRVIAARLADPLCKSPRARELRARAAA